MEPELTWFGLIIVMAGVYWPISIALSICLAIWGACIKSRGWSTALWLAAVTPGVLGFGGLFFGLVI